MHGDGEAFLSTEPEVPKTSSKFPARLVAGVIAAVAPLGMITMWRFNRNSGDWASISTDGVMEKIRAGQDAYAYESLGDGACLKPDGSNPDNTYLSILEQATMENCDTNAKCKGYSQSTGCRGAFLFYNEQGSVIGGGYPLKDSHTWKRARCMKKRLDWKFKVLGYGKCVRADGSEPTYEYSGDMTEMAAREKCAKDSQCKGFSAGRMNYKGILFWKEGNLKAGGRNHAWKVSYCIVKEGAAAAAGQQSAPAPAPPPPPSVQYRNLGKGKCRAANGGNLRARWVSRGNSNAIRQQCTDNPHCGGYSASLYGGGLLFLSSDLRGGGSSWGRCSCYVKR